jgi:tetratricopeptide (TPR) repeat protein
MDEARRELEISLSLDPSDGCDDTTRCTGFSGGRIARVLYYQQKLDSALARYEAIPFIGGFAWEKAMVLGAAGRAVEGLTLLDSVRQNVVENHDREAVRALLLITLGRTDEALVHLESVSTRPPTGLSHFHHAQFVIACTYAGLGRNREAVEWLRRAADNGMPNYPLFRNDPYLKGLQGDPAYESFMRSLEQEYQSNLRLVRSESLP